MLCLPRNTLNRKVILMLGIPTLVESLVIRGIVPATNNYHTYLQLLEDKLTDVEEDFFISPVITQDKWKNGLNDRRQLSTRLSTHGFHFKLCIDKTFHLPGSSQCRCLLCNQDCPLLHALSCPQIPSLDHLNSL